PAPGSPPRRAPGSRPRSTRRPLRGPERGGGSARPATGGPAPALPRGPTDPGAEEPGARLGRHRRAARRRRGGPAQEAGPGHRPGRRTTGPGRWAMTEPTDAQPLLDLIL